MNNIHVDADGTATAKDHSTEEFDPENYDMSIDDKLTQISDAADAETADVVTSTNDDSGTRRRKRRKMFCFHCNRNEGHSNPYIGSWFYSYFIGLTFGLVHFFGPYRCQCCGRNRLMFADWINPRFYVLKAKQR